MLRLSRRARDDVDCDMSCKTRPLRVEPDLFGENP